MEEKVGKFGKPLEAHHARRFEVVGIAAIIVEHDPIAVGEGRRPEVVVMRFLDVGRLLQKPRLAGAEGLA